LVVVVLVGIPGSGKSTFAETILAGAGDHEDGGVWVWQTWLPRERRRATLGTGPDED
jgi:adenylate kinase family enzyme